MYKMRTILFKPKIAILFPAFFRGGAESVSVWMMEALKNEYDLTLISLVEPDINDLNAYYGSNLSEDDVRVEGSFLEKNYIQFLRYLNDSHKFYSLRQHLLIRYFKKVKDKYDLSISAFNEMDMGKPGIQYIHYPMFARGHENVRKVVGHPDSLIRRTYRYTCRIISNFSESRMRKNVTIANSKWTANVIKKAFGIEARVIYPPVLSDFPEITWEEKEDGFICISRVVQEKKIEKAIEILEGVRSQGYDVHLHICGGGYDPNYFTTLRNLLNRHSKWVFLEEGLSRQDFARLVAKHKYGIHVRENEQFGIAVAEMVKAGCIPFVPDKGGQIEIIGGNSWITFNNEDTAVEKIVNVLSSNERQRELCIYLGKMAHRFSAKKFMMEIQKCVSEFVSCR